MEIKIKYLSQAIDEIKPDAKGNWIDLRSAETITIPKGGYALIHLGVCMKIPKGYEAHLAPRSSTFKNFGVIQTNGVGIIDNSYCGDKDEWCMPVYATRATQIQVNDRICQFRIVPIMEDITMKKVKKLENESRGGFGSTGKS